MKNKLAYTLTFLFILCLNQIQAKGLTPFDFLNKKSNIIITYQKIGQAAISDTLNNIDIQKLCELKFKRKNYKVEMFGVTPDHTFNLYEDGKRIALVSIWVIDSKEIAININLMSKNKFLFGYLIDQEEFYKLFSTFKEE